MRIRLYGVLLAAVLAAALLLTACGEKNTDQTNETTAAAHAEETTAVIATTAEGGSVEQDAQGNRITRDQNGTVISIKDDKDQPVDVDGYLEQHPWVPGTLPGNSDGAVIAPSDSPQEDVEGTIPVIIATIPDDDDLIELPDLDDSEG